MRKLAMTEMYDIKNLYENEGLSYRAIMAKTGHSYRTVKKYADRTDWNVDEQSDPNERSPRYPVLGPMIPIIDAILEADRKVPRKQRHTAKRIHVLLCEEHDFKGSYSAVKKYVSKKKKALGTHADDGALPLKQIPGTAQVDFGEVVYLDDSNAERKAWMLAVSFPYSNRAYARLVPSQNQDCFLESMKDIMETAGGVPIAMRFDNLKPAVRRVLVGRERELTEGFARFAAHYGFRTEFCAPAAGNEKGNVENKVGYVRRNFFNGLPQISSFQEVNAELDVWCEKDSMREHYRHGELIAELWKEDLKALRELPAEPLRICHDEYLVLNKYGYATFETNKYGLDPTLNGSIVRARVWYDRIEFFNEGELLCTYPRSYGKREENLNPVMYLKASLRKPNAVTETRFFDGFPESIRKVLAGSTSSERRSILELLQELTEHSSFDECAEAFSMAGENGMTDAQSIRQCHLMIARYGQRSAPAAAPDVPEIAVPNQVKLQNYDCLTGGGLHA